jgi:predicted AAA+ superfamily ATPase
MFRRKIYNRLLSWKQDSNGHTAMLIEGARRVGKTTLVKEFAKREYDSYILIDFSKAPLSVRKLFDDMSDLNYFFLQLQLNYNTKLTERKSLIVLNHGTM